MASARGRPPNRPTPLNLVCVKLFQRIRSVSACLNVVLIQSVSVTGSPHLLHPQIKLEDPEIYVSTGDNDCLFFPSAYFHQSPPAATDKADRPVNASKNQTWAKTPSSSKPKTARSSSKSTTIPTPSPSSHNNPPPETRSTVIDLLRLYTETEDVTITTKDNSVKRRYLGSSQRDKQDGWRLVKTASTAYDLSKYFENTVCPDRL